MVEILDQLKEIALDKSASYTADVFLIHGLWQVNLLFRPNLSERLFNYSLMLAQTQGQGCSYCEGSDGKLLEGLIGQDARYVNTDDMCLRVALLDAIYSSFPTTPRETIAMDGHSSAKAAQRAAVVVREILRQVENIRQRAPKVANIGVVGNFIETLLHQGISVTAADLDQALIGHTIHGVLVEGGERTTALVAESDVALVTGMTLATQTLSDIIEAAQSAGTKLIIFAETGANFGEEYCSTFGVDVAISEQFPFYIFDGRSIINLYRRNP